MKRTVTVLLLVAASAAFAAPQRAQWTEIGHGAGGSLAYETTTLKHQGSRVLVWVRLTYIPDQHDATGTYDGQLYHVSIDCANDMIGFRGVSNTLRGVTVSSSDLQTDGDQIEPDSVFYYVEQAACK
ncbi:hypothetical protein X880_793 [Burkholderia pseudomallei MSHR4032]|uniref:surface-adhesin E family protein n=1 Tax=Burkholderia pseudomallei TaxID=28450 RepID=UPI0005368AFF|nr:surface-adhesin E family protein [Burkholderia pseudomallei]KGV02908.1 hypothetical protein X880_793 [Burkholderia pseudomallei MSHR4032]